MATGAKMFNYYQNGKYGTLPQNHQKDLEVSQDLHLKMSKKIAQLTKVIYALNTKNDEHEALMQYAREQHEEEIQRLLGETREKISVYQAKVGVDVDYKIKVEILETALNEHIRQKEIAMEEVSRFKKIAEEREQALKVGHSERMLKISQEVLHTKKEFENHLSSFRDWRQNLELEQAKQLAALKEEHEKELTKIRNFQRNQNSDWLNECAKIEGKYKTEIDRLTTEFNSICAEKDKLEAEFDAKHAKAQAFFDRELEALKNFRKQEQETDLMSLKEQNEQMKKNFAAQESRLCKQIDELTSKLLKQEDDVERHKAELGKLMASLQDRTSSTNTLYQQLEETKKQLNEAGTRLSDSERILSAHKEKCSVQQEELLKKSSIIGELEAVRCQQTGVIEDLQAEMSRLQTRLNFLESEKNSIELKRKDLTAKQLSQLKSLELELEEVNLQKQTLQQRLEKEIALLKEKHAQLIKQLESEHSAAVANLISKNKEEQEKTQAEARELLQQTTKELQQNYDSTIAHLTSENKSVLSEFENVKADLLKKLSAAEEEVVRLEQLVRQSESGLGTASSHISNLKDAANRLKSELDSSRAELNASRVANAALQAEMDRMKLQYENKLAENEQTMKEKLDQLNKDLDAKWTSTLRSECSKLQVELAHQKEDELKAALLQLSKLKEEELKTDRVSWERRVQELSKQIQDLIRIASSQACEWDSERMQLLEEAERERKRLTQDMLKAAEDYASKVERLEKMHKEHLNRLAEQMEAEKQEHLQQLKKQHLDDMHHQITAHKMTMDSALCQAEEAHQTAISSLKKEHQHELDAVHQKMLEQQKQELEQQGKTHQAELQAARIELERAMEISKQKDRDHQLTSEELHSEINHREQHIKNLREEISKLKETINQLKQEIDQKCKEILRIRNEAIANLKQLESHLKEEHEHSISNMRADHLHEVDGMVTEFRKAQELLKEKISALQISLQEADEKYKNRESRLEDLQMIQQLREVVMEKEQHILELVDEKRFYQLELVNRETNFNKVFNSTPNVGVLNPLNFKKKRGDIKNVVKHSSAPSLAPHKLEPLPGSPLHDESLNPAKPLPMPAFTKKFVK